MPYIPCPHCNSRVSLGDHWAPPNVMAVPPATSKHVHDLTVERDFYRSHYDRADEVSRPILISVFFLLVGVLIGASIMAYFG